MLGATKLRWVAAAGALLASPAHLVAQCEVQALEASPTLRNAYFGRDVAIAGDFAFVGQPEAFGGSVFVFEREGTGWLEDTELTAPDGLSGDQFGVSVAAFEDQLVVGAFEDDLPELDPFPPGGNEAGSAYYFAREDGAWVYKQKLTASDGEEFANFGAHVAMSADWLVVGAFADDNSNGDDAGAVYVFSMVDGKWVESAKLTASDGVTEQYFGAGVAVEGDAIVASAWLRDAVYVFRYQDGEWMEEQVLEPLVADAAFGFDVAISGEVIGVGCPASDAGAEHGGAVAVFTLDGGRWVEDQCLTASDASSSDEFGTAVAIDGQLLLIGARIGDADSANDTGAAYLFYQDGDTWKEVAKLTASDAAFDAALGESAAIDGSYGVVGAPLAGFNRPGAAYALVLSGSDCDASDALDLCEIAADGTLDQNENLILDGCELGFLRGDCNADGEMNVSDAILNISYQFREGVVPCELALDVDGTGTLSIADPIYHLNFMFLAGPAPPDPFLGCGVGSAPSALSCLAFPPCEGTE